MRATDLCLDRARSRRSRGHTDPSSFAPRAVLWGATAKACALLQGHAGPGLVGTGRGRW
jgi:hypothetical protein